MRSGQASRPRFAARGTVLDIAAAVLLAYLAVAATVDPPGPAFTGPMWAAWLAGAAAGLPLAVRRRWPVPVLVWVLAATTAATATGVVGIGVIWATYAPVALALYTTATATGPVTATLALAGGLAGPAVAIPWLYHGAGISAVDELTSEVPLWWQVELGVVAVLTVAAWAAGRMVRWRRAVRADVARRLTREAVAAERLRIARELHDIVGHSMSLIAVKATVANHIAEERPAETRAALLTIEETSREALTEMRRLLDVLRSDDEPAERSPPPGTAELSGLADRLRAAGLRVDLRVEGADGLPPAVGLTVFRIVQEAFTNVMRHADARHCRATVLARDGVVRLEIVDDGRGQGDGRGKGNGVAVAGRGLIGMRERVMTYGGELTAGPDPDGGFRVTAEIPYAEAVE